MLLSLISRLKQAFKKQPKVCFTAALRVSGMPYWHCTVAFCTAVKAGKVATHSGILCNAKITGVEYWPGANVTVLLIEAEEILARQQYYESLGYPYEGFAYRPHVTVAYGADKTAEYQGYVSRFLELENEYVRIYVKG